MFALVEQLMIKKINLLFVLSFYISSVFGGTVINEKWLLDNWPKPVGRQQFIEYRHDVLLKLDSEYRGYFTYKKLPDGAELGMHYLQPGIGSMLISPQQLTVRFPDSEKVINLDNIPGVQAFLLSLDALLRGQPQQFLNDYQHTFSKTPDQHWHWKLLPEESRNMAISQIIVNGQQRNKQPDINSIELDFVNGDQRRFQLKHER